MSGEALTIDPTSPTPGVNIGQRAIQNLPTGRDYTSVVQIAPGVSTDASNNNADQTTITVYGSSGAENAYLIDGANTTNIEYGLEGKQLNFEFIQEIDVKTGGYEAEYGRATGGIVNVITRSGGNEFHGDAFGYYDNDSLQASTKNVGETLQGAAVGFTRDDWGADLGGYILKDRLWFFGAYDRVTRKTTNALTAGPFEGQTVESKSVRNLGSGKLTWGFASGHTLVASLIQDPRTDSGARNAVASPGPTTHTWSACDLAISDAILATNKVGATPKDTDRPISSTILWRNWRTGSGENPCCRQSSAASSIERCSSKGVSVRSRSISRLE